MGRQLAIAAELGAASGAIAALAAFWAVTTGTDIYFRIAEWRAVRAERTN